MLYLLSGLGADERVFARLIPLLRAPSRFLPWLAPRSGTEPLPAYAARMAASIPLDAPCWLVGVSFGGTMALEIARLRPLARVVLVSSIPDANPLPALLRLARALRVWTWVPPQLLPMLPRVGQWFFGVANGAEYALFKQILRELDPVYTRWAVRSLLTWDSTSAPGAIQILGTRDRVFPPGPAPVEYLIRGGTHFMAYSRAEEIAAILNELTSEQTT